MTLPGPVSGDFECTGINLIGGMAGATPAQGGDVTVNFVSTGTSILRGSVSFTTDINTAKAFEVGGNYSLTAAETSAPEPAPTA